MFEGNSGEKLQVIEQKPCRIALHLRNSFSRMVFKFVDLLDIGF